MDKIEKSCSLVSFDFGNIEREGRLKKNFRKEVLKQAEEFVISYTQRKNFSSEPKALEQFGKVGHKTTDSNKIQKLDPVMINGIMRVRGRLE